MYLTVTLTDNDQNTIDHVGQIITLIRQMQMLIRLIQNVTETTLTGGHLNHPRSGDRGASPESLRSRRLNTDVESPEKALMQSTTPHGNARVPLRSSPLQGRKVAIADKPRRLFGAVPQRPGEALSAVGAVRDWRVKEQNRI